MISKKSKYALKALEVLAEHYTQATPLLISEIAAKGKSPKKFLEVILLELKNKGILASRKGKGGGYLLAMPPSAIKIGNVLRAIEGPLAPLPCLSKTAYRKCDECENEENCGIRLVMKDAFEAQLAKLESVSLQCMLDRKCTAELTGSYEI
jgi:Rrf2 family protein